jgi:hypothetical protein
VKVSSSNQVKQLKHLYDRFNARDVEAALVLMHRDVMWANGFEGGHVCGRCAVREYWKRQWGAIDPHVDPIDFSSVLDGEVIVEVRQVVRDLQGTLLADQMVVHIFGIESGLIKRFDIYNP